MAKTHFSKKEFKNFFKSKEDLGKEFNINPNNTWCLFISSFSLANPNEELMTRIIKDMKSKENAEYFHDISFKSQNKILEWIEKFISNNPDYEFIYRPHPSEIKQNDVSKFKKLEDKYSNFHFIFKYSVQDWIMSCDIINTWISTSIVDVYFLNKKCNILRPIKIKEKFDIPIYVNSKQITSYEDFEKHNIDVSNNIFPVEENLIKDYYNIGEELNYKLICDFIDEIIDDEYNMEYYFKSPLLDNLKFIFDKIKGNRIIPIMKSFFNRKVMIYQIMKKKIRKV